ncbi:MAG: DNA repair protein RecO [Alphaproteobacteria bacterium]|nr:DNA repair protein RecO [Alphaproteobacteria bacterium]
MTGSAELDAIVVGWVDVGESDRILRLLSAEEGRVALSARRVRGSSRMAGLFELGAAVRVQRARGRGGHWVLRSAERLGGPRRAREDLERIALLGYGCELCAALAPEAAAAEKLHGLLLAWLDLLEAPAAIGPTARPALEAKALTFAGLMPAITRCAACGEALEEPVVFDPEAGGALHARCGGGAPVRLGGLRALEVARRTPLAEGAGLPPLDLPRWLLGGFVTWQLGRPLQSRALLEALG